MEAAHCKLASLPSQESISAFKQENQGYYFLVIKQMSDTGISGWVSQRFVV